MYMYGLSQNIKRRFSTPESVVPFDLDTVKILLRCFLHILNNLDQLLLTDFWLQCSPKELETFFSILKMSVNIFKFVEKKKLGMAPNLRVSISHGSQNINPYHMIVGFEILNHYCLISH